MPSRKPPIAGLVDLFSDEFGALAPAIIRDIRAGLKAKMDVRAAVDKALAKNGVTRKIQSSILDKMVTASAIGFGIEPKLVLDPVGIRKSFLNTTWPGDRLTLSRRIAAQEYRQLITDTISAQMSRGRSWTETAEALSNPLKAGGPDLIRAELSTRITDLADSAKRVAAGAPEDLLEFRRKMAAAKRHVARLSLRGAPNQTLKTIYSEVIAAAEELNEKALDKAVQQAVRDKARYNAERIARTEIARAYGAGEDLAQMEDEDVIAERWQLSSRHPQPDICDFHSNADLYGMGPGVYPKDRKPPYPGHPHCLCLKIRIFVGELEPNDKMDPDAGRRYLDGLPLGQQRALLGVGGHQEFVKRPDAWQKHLKSWQGHKPVVHPKGLKPEMFTGPPGFQELPPAQAVTEKVAIVEKRIRKQRFESAAAFNDRGEMVLFKDGDRYEIYFTDAEKAKLRGTTFTHNHPRGWNYPEGDLRRGGNSFSIGDIGVAASSEMKEIRAASPLYDHSMKPPAGGWSGKFFEESILPAYQRIERRVYDESVLAVRAGLMTLEQAEARHFHEVWTRVAAELGLIYERKRISE